MGLPSASELTKEVVIDKSFFNTVSKKITDNKSEGRIAINCGWRCCSPQSKDYCVKQLKERGYSIGYKNNSHGVEMMVVTW